MSWGEPIGLDELMIINPGLPGQERYRHGRARAAQRPIDDSDDLYLSDDGEIFRLIAQPSRHRRSARQLSCACRRC